MHHGQAASHGQLDSLLERLAVWSRAHTGSRIVWRETWAQHFATSNGQGQYQDRDENAMTCAPVLGEYPRSFAEVARRVMAASVRFVPTFDFARGRGDLHRGGTKRDCTHYCYTPLFFEPLLSRLADAVLDDDASFRARGYIARARREAEMVASGFELDARRKAPGHPK